MKINANRLWTLFLVMWMFLLSGVMTPFLGSPGVLQAMELRSLLSTRQAELTDLTAKTKQLQVHVARLEKNYAVEDLEIRRVLGYVGPKDIIFDFTGDKSP